MSNPEFKSIEELWGSYRIAVVHPQAGAVQLEETRKAFFAGFISMLLTVTAMGNSKFPASVAIQWLERYTAEMNAEVLRVIRQENPENN